MKAGKVRIMRELFFRQGVFFPSHWKVLSIYMTEDDKYAETIIEAPQFPDVPESGEPLLCTIKVTRNSNEYEFEVQKGETINVV